MEDRIVPKRTKQPSVSSTRTRTLLCPECGGDLAHQDIIRHRNSHWGGLKPDPERYPEAAKRWEKLTKMAKAK